MPKIKTHKGVAKRFKLTATGKVMHLRGGGKAARHLRRNKSKSTKRAYDRTVPLENKSEAERVKVLAPYLNKKKRS